MIDGNIQTIQSIIVNVHVIVCKIEIFNNLCELPIKKNNQIYKINHLFKPRCAL